MADQDILHTAEVMKAALPYIDPKYRGRAEFLTKMIDLMGSLSALSKPDNLAACGYEKANVDMEGLLTGIRPVCNKREREFVDRILNIFSMKRMYEMYSNLMSTMKTMQEFGGFPFGDQNPGDEAGSFSGMNFESIFNSFKNATENAEDFVRSTDNGTPSMDHTEAFTDNFESDTKTFLDNLGPDTKTFFDNHEPDSKTFHGYPSDDSFKDNAEVHASSDHNNGLGNNKMFFEMLKTMIPPEQLSTFENLSMLLNSMSYDNNNKPMDSEENKNG